ncbi:hypothetical protein AZF37_03990 [endosymbiont 'TC1' of Trimyema compressum]|uniref:glutamate racemase n=1 Tax=endosymbiont 'TC1' of Trimyema compressum TaxID=243899 RepID=UPI0007F0A137|nr:glutamate racemase [endosymbiont 'TC1' of Trimyema compressum]AMP20443.1 hypothetical protein AZF37_03990 [endosymbiont 'TC1' of Trimyema compressum]
MAIGVFDSGIGGITVVKEIRKQLPDEKIIYFGDTKRVPYGGKDKEELINLSEQIVAFLIREGADVIIDACNTTSALALPYLQEKHTVPIVGVLVPGADSASKVTKGKVGVMGTEATIKSGCYDVAIKAQEKSTEVVSIHCPKLVGFIEDGDLNSSYLKRVLRDYLNPLFLANCDTLVLGCTHYPFLSDTIYELIGDSMTLINPAVAAVNELKAYESSREGEDICYISGDYHSFYSALTALYPDHGFEKIVTYDPIEE